MAAYVQHVSGSRGQGTGVGLAFPGNTTSGNAIVVLLNHSYLGCAPTVADTQGNTYTVKGAQTQPGPVPEAGYPYVFTATTSSTAANTITVSFACGTLNDVLIVEASGLQSDPFDVQNGAEFTASPANAGSITPSADGALILACFHRQVVLSATATSSPFTLRDAAVDVAYLTGVQTTAAAISPDITCSASSTYKVWGICAAFKAAGASIPSVASYFPGINQPYLDKPGIVGY